MKSTIRFEQSAHYHFSKTVHGQEDELWIVLHGYGQLAEYFLKKFVPFFKENRLIVAPEANNHSYLKGFTGRVGANWMTSHERETAILNNHRYLNTLLEFLLLRLKNNPTIKVLGFSQGAATATRWVSQLKVPVDTLVLCSGGFAHDLTLPKSSKIFKDMKVYSINGLHDPMLTDEVKEKQQAMIEALGISVVSLTFDGEHELDEASLRKIFG